MRVIAYMMKDLRIFLKSKVSVFLSFLVPMVIILIFGSIFGGMGKTKGIPEIKVLCTDNDNSEFSSAFTEELDKLSELKILKNIIKNKEEFPMTTEDMDNLIRKGNYGVGILLPTGFEKSVLAGDSLAMEIHYDPKFAVEYGILTGMIQKTIPTRFPQLMFNGMWKMSEEALGSDKNREFRKNLETEIANFFPEAEFSFRNERLSLQPLQSNDNTAPDLFSNIINMKSVQLVGQEVQNNMFSQYVAGMAVMFLLFSVNATAGALLFEKREGTLKRLLISPVQSIEILLGKMLFCILLGMSQLIILFLFGWAVFKLNIFRDIPSLLTVMFATAVTCTSLGIFLATVCKTERQVDSLSTLIVLSMSALGGSMVPTFIMPPLIQSIGKFTINHWAMKGFTDIFWRQLSFLEILPSVLVLLGISLTLILISFKLYKKRIFDID
ncbi:MAG: ABC transporter permease [Candidatus Cloacimonetes bacterium]|nr:ABC transporter permease [Candidatus Cloacimonadota bacterium]